MEQSESGSPIYRHSENSEKSFEPASGDSSIDEISNHIVKYVGTIEIVFHEIVSDNVHIDVHWVKPSVNRPFHTLITSGMSDKPMNTPNNAEGNEYAELSICLPIDWDLTPEGQKDERNYWPIRWLKYLARFPHVYDTWLSFGHTIPNGNPAEPFANNTMLNTALLLPTTVFDDAFRKLELETKTIHFYTLIPLYSEEVNLKLKKGVEALYTKFDRFGINDILDINRKNTAKKRFGLF